MINVLVFNLYGGSHLKNSIELTKWLKDQQREDGNAKYNVTAFVYADNDKFTESDNLHIFRANARRDEGPSETEISQYTDMMDIVNAVSKLAQLTNRLLNEDFHLLKQVKESFDIDVILADLNMQDTMNSNYLDKPTMGQFFYMPQQDVGETFGQPRQYNSFLGIYGPLTMQVENPLINTFAKFSEIALFTIMVATMKGEF